MNTWVWAALPYATSRRCTFLRMSFTILLGASIFILWFGMNSDRDNVSPILNRLIPAGHCACQTSTLFNCSHSLVAAQKGHNTYSGNNINNESCQDHWEYQYPRDARNQGLSSARCDAAFPGLFEDIHRAVSFWKSRGGISQQRVRNIPLNNGMVHGKIYSGQLHILKARAEGDDHRRKIMAVLSSIHRALTASSGQEGNSDIEFVFSIEDLIQDVANAHEPIWALARKASEQAAWLYPDFGFWSWSHNVNDFGPYDEILADILELEEIDVQWSTKIDKLVWRGKLSFAPKLRRALLDVARGQSWGDVKELVWESQNNLLTMQQHCRYRFIAHVEGRSYSASLKYRQACHSVIVMHKLQFIQHHHYLLSPSGPTQNFVEVERDFADLPKNIEHLLNTPKEAQRIADNSVSTFRERYLTPAAEACYWRSLWNGWSQVYDPSLGAQDDDRKGKRYESFILLPSTEMMHFES